MHSTILRQATNGALWERWEDGQGLRWRFHWGPSDVFISALGPDDLLVSGLQRAWELFCDLLPGLVLQLASLRSSNSGDWPVEKSGGGAADKVASRMVRVVRPYAEQGLFITPMAAVAGSIAQELLACFTLSKMQKVIVNNGGDIAFYLAKAEVLRCGVHQYGSLTIGAAKCCSGLATSGIGGRSFTLGIADSVTIVADTAAQADAAATMVANAVNIEHPGIQRRAANSLRDDTDLAGLLVTTSVPILPAIHVAQALQHGLAFAQQCRDAGLIRAALLCCQGQTVELDMKGMWQ
jgi:uncharacterized protein